jgi:hypothetical protein
MDGDGASRERGAPSSNEQEPQRFAAFSKACRGSGLTRELSPDGPNRVELVVLAAQPPQPCARC